MILRPSPYICAEWEFGGLPAWLLAEDGMKLRVSYPPFLKHVQDYYDVLLKKIVPYQINYGGPVILMRSKMNTDIMQTTGNICLQ